MIAMLVAGGLWLPSAQAQFHQQGKTGQATINQQAVQQTRMQAAAAPSHSRVGAASSDVGAAYSGGDMILPEGKRQALSQWNPKLGQMSGKYADVWGRAIHHSNGNFTESKQDMESNTLEQLTKSKNGTLLQKRMIMLDQSGRPAEAMIYDGRNQFKYRGVLLYDVIGRFSEEQLYDPQGTLIRRKVQEYTPEGLKKPLRSWDYVANVPADLELVITRDALPEEQRLEEATSPNRGLFKKREDSSPTNSQAQNSEAAAAKTESGTSEKRKGLGLGRLFGK